MARMGRPPKPTVIKLIEGDRSHGKSVMLENEFKPDKGSIKCPSWLDKYAKQEWKRIAPELEEKGVLTSIDTTTLAAYCQCYSRWRKAEEFIQKNGDTFETEKGYVAQRPQVNIAIQSLKMLNSFAVEFGLTPSSRTRVAMKSTDKANIDPLEEMLG